MLVIRPIRESDLDALFTFARTTHVSLTSLPRNREALERKIRHSLTSFAKEVSRPQKEAYYFIMEDLASGQAAGTCGILSKTGVDEPLYFWRRERVPRYSPALAAHWEDEILRPVAYRQGPSEICQLYLFPDYRKGGLGRLLSLSRFLFMASHPHRFEPTIMAQMRGFLKEDGTCPFWDYLGRQYWNVSFVEALAATEKSKECIPEFLPQHPIYTALLHPECQRAIQSPHKNTAPALRMLQQEGFQVTDEMDIFDAGPRIDAQLENIRVVKENRQAKVRQVNNGLVDSERTLLANTSLDYRCCYGGVEIMDDGESVVIARDVAEALKIDVGSAIRYVSPVPNNTLRRTVSHSRSGSDE